MNATLQSARVLVFSLSVLSAAPTMAANHAVSIKGFAFSPAQLSIAVGDTVTFTNKDGAPHTATATDGSFNTGTISPGGSKTVTIGAAGSHAYKCNFHSSMRGSVSAK